MNSIALYYDEITVDGESQIKNVGLKNTWL